MKEIQAISQLSHKNIVGYKGCWIEADEPDFAKVKKINSRFTRRHARVVSIREGIDESSADDSEFALNDELQTETE